MAFYKYYKPDNDVIELERLGFLFYLVGFGCVAVASLLLLGLLLIWAIGWSLLLSAWLVDNSIHLWPQFQHAFAAGSSDIKRVL